MKPNHKSPLFRALFSTSPLWQRSVTISASFCHRARAFFAPFLLRVIGVCGVCVLIGASTLSPTSVTRDRYFEIVKNIDIFATLFKQLYAYHVDEATPTLLMREAIKAMLRQLDPYTIYIPEEDIESYRTMTTGVYGGIGASIAWRGDQLVISNLQAESPAARAGLKIGDRLLSINAVSVADKAEEDLLHLLKGQVGTRLRLKVLRMNEKEPLYFDLEREKVVLKSVPYRGMLSDSVAYIRLAEFTKGAALAVEDAYAAVKAEKVKGLVLDLRGNPGGLLSESVAVANFFIPRGLEVVRAQGRLKEWNRIYYAEHTPLDTLVRIVVLVDERSASASEIVSGVIQDYDRGVIVGRKTYGKGLVQTVIPLVYNAQLKITTARYYTPSGRCIQSIDYTPVQEGAQAASYNKAAQSLFRTRSGRPVYDRGGIEPDLEVPPLDDKSPLLKALLGGYFIFDYATQYAQSHASIASLNGFQLSDLEYADFCDWIARQPKPLQIEADIHIAHLKASLRKHRLDSTKWRALTKALETQVEEAKRKALESDKAAIKQLLEAEIIKRYYYEVGVLEATMDHDADVQSAVSLLSNEARYRALLSPNP